MVPYLIFQHFRISSSLRSESDAAKEDRTVPKTNWLAWAAYSVFFLGALSLLLTTIGAVGNRTGLLHYRQALGLFLVAGNYSLTIAGTALAVLIATILKKARRPQKIAAAAGLFLAMSIYVPYYLFEARVHSVPRIHDITTDTEDPPIFVKVKAVRPPGVNTVEYGGPTIAQQQLSAYPEVKPAYLNLDKNAAFERVLKVVKDLGWDIVDTDLAAGRIEATDTTFFYGFKDDVVIRIREESPLKTRIDIRSASRVGLSDVGVNADRVSKFLRAL